MTFHEKLQSVIDSYVDTVYRVTKKFPKDELFGATSQLRRATLSIALNYIEGYARQRKAVYKNFLEISYGSLKESAYLVTFGYRQKYIMESDFKELQKQSNEIGAMLWSVLSRIS